MLATQQNSEIKTIDKKDKKIISATQQGLPLTRYPYHAVAEQTGMDVQEVIARIKSMTESGVIRRTGIVPNHYQLGFRANGMSVWNVPTQHINVLGELVGALDFVSHCYERPRFLPQWPYNLFAMVHAKSREDVFVKVELIESLLAEKNLGHEVLFSSKILKKTGLRI